MDDPSGHDSVQQPPTASVVRLTELLRLTVEQWLTARSAIQEPLTYESTIGSVIAMNLVVRHVEAVAELGRTDLVLAAPAAAVARAAYEAAVRVRWVMDPEDPFDREVRWLVLLRERENYHESVQQIQGVPNKRRTEHHLHLEAIRSFRLSVEGMLPTGYEPLRALPTVRTMLEQLKAPSEYESYRTASQFVHGTSVAMDTYVRNLGTRKEFGEFVTQADWQEPLRLCWESLTVPAVRILERCGANAEFPDKKISHEVRRRLGELQR